MQSDVAHEKALFRKRSKNRFSFLRVEKKEESHKIESIEKFFHKLLTLTPKSHKAPKK